jgi:hypothetical protein
MSAPLISDATFAKCVRLVSTFAMPNEDRWNIVRELIAGRYAVALDVVRDDRENATLIEALEEANEEAALGHDRREAEATPTAGLTWDTKPPTGEQIIADIEEMMRVFPPTTLDAIVGHPDVLLKLGAAWIERLTKERDEARAELAATKKKLQGILFGKRRRS